MIVEILSVGYGVMAMIGWGLGDVLTKKVVGHVGYYRLLVYTQLVGLAPVFVLTAVSGLPMPSSLTTIALIVGTGICSASAMLFFYKGLEVGRASIVTPVVSTSAIVSIALSFAILGETLSLPQAACIAMTFGGVLIITMRARSGRSSGTGISYALGAMVAAGLNAILIKLVSVETGAIGALFFNRVLLMLILLMAAPFLGSPLPAEAHGRVPLMSIFAIGLVEFVGFFSLLTGVSVGLVSIVASLSNASPAVTVVLAQVFLKERLLQIQKMAVALVIAGILLLSIAPT